MTFRGQNNTMVKVIAKAKYTLLVITSNRIGFETILSIPNDKLLKVLNGICNNAFDRAGSWGATYDRGIRGKHKELTRGRGEIQATTKYFDAPNVSIDLTHAGDSALISVYTPNKHFVTISCNVYELQKCSNKIISMINEAKHREWLS